MEARPNIAVRFLPSLADFAFLVPIALLFSCLDGVKTLLGDCDTGWHIRTGEWILAHSRIPTVDVFSYSRPGAPWYAWEWLSDVIFAKLVAWGGLRLVVVASIVLICVTTLALYKLVARKATPVVAFAVTLMAAAISSIHWLARPHLFTLFFLVVFYAALEQVREGRTRWLGLPILAILPVASILWTNLHGGFFVGALMIFAFGGGEALQLVLKPGADGPGAGWRRVRGYFLSGVACLAASLVNPYGYHLHTHMVEYLGNPWNGQHIAEFLSPSFHHPLALFFEVLLVLGVLSAVWHIRRGRFTEGLLMFVWAHGALLAARNIPIFAIVAAPAVAAVVQDWLNRLPAMDVAGWVRRAAAGFGRVTGEMAETESLWRLHLVSVLAVAMMTALVYAPNPPRTLKAEFDPKRYPAAALETLRSNPANRIFTDDEWGDYLIWSLYPGHKVFVDGRSDFYGNDFEDKYVAAYSASYNWESILNTYAVNTILLSAKAPLCAALKESSRWHVVFDDGKALVFQSTTWNAGVSVSAARSDGGEGRDREVTKTLTGDRVITETKPKT